MQNDESNVIGVTTEVGHYNFWCGGCRNAHHIYTEPDCNGNYWTFNNDLLHPTAKLITKAPYGYYHVKPCGEPNSPESFCRFDIVDGIITYHPDCSHILAGMAVQMRTRNEWGGIKFKTEIDDDGYQVHQIEFEQ